MKDERRIELLQNAARCFSECYSPFTHSELSKMNVTSDECGDLSEIIAAIIREHLPLPPKEKLLKEGELILLLKATIDFERGKEYLARSRERLFLISTDEVQEINAKAFMPLAEISNKVQEHLNAVRSVVRLGIISKMVMKENV